MGAGGAILPPEGYFQKVQEVLRKYDILFVADEVICGFARTGEMWGSETYGIVPDMLTSAKALSAAMQPISAVLVNERVHEAMLAQSDSLGNFAHGFTYAGHPVAAAVALEVLKIYDEMDIVGRAKRLGPQLQAALGAFRDHPLVGDVRGVGLIAGIELMRDKARRAAVRPCTRHRRAGRRRGPAPRPHRAHDGRPGGVRPAAGDRARRHRGDGGPPRPRPRRAGRRAGARRRAGVGGANTLSPCGERRG